MDTCTSGVCGCFIYLLLPLVHLCIHLIFGPFCFVFLSASDFRHFRYDICSFPNDIFIDHQLIFFVRVKGWEYVQQLHTFSMRLSKRDYHFPIHSIFNSILMDYHFFGLSNFKMSICLNLLSYHLRRLLWNASASQTPIYQFSDGAIFQLIQLKWVMCVMLLNNNRWVCLQLHCSKYSAQSSVQEKKTCNCNRKRNSFDKML